jgi:hypothetical protein
MFKRVAVKCNILFGFWSLNLNNLTAFVETAVLAYFMRKCWVVAVLAHGQRSFGQGVMRTALIAARPSFSLFWYCH